MKQQTAPARAHPGKALLYHLPRDLFGVQRIAYCRACEQALYVLSDGSNVSAAFLLVLAEQECMTYQHIKLDGKSGSNDPALFRSTFIQTFLDAFPKCLEALTSGEYRVPPGLSDEQRLASHYARASAIYEDAGVK